MVHQPKTALFTTVLSVIGAFIIILIIALAVYFLWNKNEQKEKDLLGVQFHGTTYHYQYYEKTDDALVGQKTGSF